MSAQAVEPAPVADGGTAGESTEIGPRQAEWEILIKLLDLDGSGVEAMSTAGIKTIGDVELFGAGAAGNSAPFLGSPLESLNLITQQKFLVIATFLLNDGCLTPETTLSEVARSNQAIARENSAPEPPKYSVTGKRGPGRPRKDGSFPPAKRGRGRPRKYPLPEDEEPEVMPIPKKRALPEDEEPEVMPIPKKRGRGRPRKNPVENPTPSATKRGRGRPRKNAS